MNKKIEAYVNSLFENAPKSTKNYELKEEISSNVNDRYHDLLESGLDENEAYNRAISNIGDVEELICYNEINKNEDVKLRKKSAKNIAIAVMMYITCPVPVILFETIMPRFEDIGTVIMFLMIAGATGLLIYNNASKPQYTKMNDTMVEEFKEWKSINDNKVSKRKTIISTMWPIIVLIYFIISFLFGNWGTSWIIFLVGGALEQVIKAYFDLKGEY